MTVSTGLDDIDRKVLTCLMRDGRATYAEIGQEVDLSAPAAKRRVDRLRAEGVIQGFTAVIDPSVVGWATEAYVEVYCSGKVSPTQLRRQFQAVPEVISACTISGSADAMLHLVAEEVQDLERAIGLVRNEDNIEQTRSAIVLSRLFDRPVGPRGRSEG